MKEPANFSTPRHAATPIPVTGFLRKYLFPTLAWPATALLLASLLWALTLSALDREYDEVRQSAMKQAASLARAYAQQLRHSVENLDRVTLNLKHDWEDLEFDLDLQHRREKRMYPNGALYASIIGRDGTLLTSTLLPDKPYNFAYERYFQHHLNNPSDDLLISVPS
jgi:hypothetical protein